MISNQLELSTMVGEVEEMKLFKVLPWFGCCLIVSSPKIHVIECLVPRIAILRYTWDL
jgi:hypothetical protein